MKIINQKMILTALVLAVVALFSIILVIGFEKPKGNDYTENLQNPEQNTKANLMQVDNIKSNQKITNPVKIIGKARGYWFFEGSFPIFIVDWDGKIIGSGVAQAKGEWMTEDFVPFEAEVSYTLEPNIYSKKGAIILQKDNPSGEPENDDALEIPVEFE